MKNFSVSRVGIVLKLTPKQVSIDKVKLISAWREMIVRIQPIAAIGNCIRRCSQTFAVETMLRIRFLQQWLLSDSVMKEGLTDIQLYCEFARLNAAVGRVPDGTTTLSFRHEFLKQNLGGQFLATINVALIALSSSDRVSQDKASKTLWIRLFGKNEFHAHRMFF